MTEDTDVCVLEDTNTESIRLYDETLVHWKATRAPDFEGITELHEKTDVDDLTSSFESDGKAYVVVASAAVYSVNIASSAEVYACKGLDSRPLSNDERAAILKPAIMLEGQIAIYIDMDLVGKGEIYLTRSPTATLDMAPLNTIIFEDAEKPKESAERLERILAGIQEIEQEQRNYQFKREHSFGKSDGGPSLDFRFR
jgi:hypothetical protein